MANICSNCGNNLPPDSIFCNKCGTKVIEEIFCTKCGNKMTSDSNFCNKCGTKVTSKLDCENTTTGSSTVTNNPFTNINVQPINPFTDMPQPTKANLPSWNNPFSNTRSNANSNINSSYPIQTVKEITYDEIMSNMVDCPAGTFVMGSSEVKEATPHTVTISKEFKIGKYPVIQALYKAVMGKNPSCFKGLSNPVESVSWYDAKEFCEKLNRKFADKLPSGYIFDLPTEAQWEYACRAGTTTKYCNGDSETSLGEVAWYDSNSGSKTHPVGQKKPNAWGIYDMHGNVWEWCRDWYGDYPSGSVTDPVGPSVGLSKVRRGGSFETEAQFCRVAYRNNYNPQCYYKGLSFRLAIVPIK